MMKRWDDRDVIAGLLQVGWTSHLFENLKVGCPVLANAPRVTLEAARRLTGFKKNEYG